MKKIGLIALIPIVITLFAMLAPTASAAQPPLVLDTLYVDNIGWGPGRADTARIYDTGSGALIFQSYDTLIRSANEMYWEFEPSLAINVPTRVEVEETFTESDFVWQIVIRSEMPLPPPPILNPNGTWWEDHFPIGILPFDCYNITNWVDVDVSGSLTIGDIVQTNDYWWAPEIALQIELKQCHWWIVNDVQYLEGNPFHPFPIHELVLTWIPMPGSDPVWKWFTGADAGKMYCMEYWIDNNPDGVIGFCDVVYLKQYAIMQVTFEKIGPRLYLLPETARAWHILDYAAGPPEVLYLHRFYYDFIIPSTRHVEKESLGWGGSTTYYCTRPPLVDGTEVLYLNDTQVMSGYSVDYATGVITFDVAPAADLIVYASYDFYISFALSKTDPIQYIDTFDIYDAEYSLKRGLVQDQLYSPQWMYFKPYFDSMNFDHLYDSSEHLILAAYLIDDAVEIVSMDPPTLRLNLGIDFPDNAFKQIMTQSWASMNSMTHSINIGCWNGELFTDADQDCLPDFHEIYYLPYPMRSPYDTRPLDTYGSWCGTGPYIINTISATDLIVTFRQNPRYFLGWPMAGAKSNVTYVEIRYIATWEARLPRFVAGDADLCAVPFAEMADLLEPDVPPGEPCYDPYTLETLTEVPIKTIKKITPTLAGDFSHMTFTINDLGGANPYIGTGSLPDGIPTDFFNNTHVRRAMAYGFNHTNYITEAYYGEATYRKNVLVYGLAPDYYNGTGEGNFKNPAAALIPYYYESFANAKAELQAAMFGGQSVWDQGFRFTIAYNTGNVQREIMCQYLIDFFNTLSTYEGRTGNPFQIDLLEIAWDVYLDAWENLEMPFWSIGWLADFADADNWVRPFMHPNGDYTWAQAWTPDNGWETRGPVTGMTIAELIDLAVKTPDGPQRALMYNDLQWIYYMDCPAIPVCMPTGRNWRQYWVRGYYYNGLYMSQYYRSQWKENTCWFDITSSGDGPSDGVCNMRDVNYLIRKFNVAAPAVGIVDPRWVGTYGNKGIDPYGDRICNMRDIAWAILHFNHGAEP